MTSLARLSDSIRGLLEAAKSLHDDAPSPEQLDAIIERGDFRPAEDEAIGFWFARFLTVREELWSVINEVLNVIDKPLRKVREDSDLRHFVVGYAATCLLIRLDRLLLFEVAHHSTIQRKLNEAFPEYRIPRKQYTRIFSAFVDQRNVFAIRDAMKFADRNRGTIQSLRDDENIGFIVTQLDELESTLNPSARSHIKRAFGYVSHKWRRRGVVSARNALAGVLEGVGRIASEIADLKNKSVTEDIRTEIGSFLMPGDVIVTRHAKALTNLFIPGFWPHAAYYIGRREQVTDAEINMNPRVDAIWTGDICVLESRKDGVRLRPLADTLSVDKFVVLRPNLESGVVHQAISRALQHQGKMYNFDFDFFNSDRVVCTELVYRAYDGLAGVNFPLSERAGRKTLSAEDLIDFAIESDTFRPVAIFGIEGCEAEIRYGEHVEEMLLASYRTTN
ncbi:MAG: YiiX/YebB-like N1pC/P60 family cysteine hydrolase [Gammaproteobacteria bacterium]|nr:YiiX/YebB-like N1pC/P60 family cysteine hydrolase [Gammaproteobacteria bacterium]